MQESWREGGGREGGGVVVGGGGKVGGRREEREGKGIRMNHGDFPWGEFHFVTA